VLEFRFGESGFEFPRHRHPGRSLGYPPGRGGGSKTQQVKAEVPIQCFLRLNFIEGRNETVIKIIG